MDNEKEYTTQQMLEILHAHSVTLSIEKYDDQWLLYAYSHELGEFENKNDSLDVLVAQAFEPYIKELRPLAGKNVVLSGELEHMERGSLASLLKLKGATLTASVSGSTDILVSNAPDSYKVKVAEGLGVKIMSEVEALEVMNIKIMKEGM